ncbi:MFS transporter [Ktedonosporobacter rubrisoli]|uniref:MFS transporter n=1 Tax=Ktedonosporobacter rubrisoli TaxID=2509675 RepID=A0A4P6JHV3_KTERU|nr:MFS transporter [Ktedonosporobacter rubrisoli]QBD74482.1 MFS transporter [Ktedonosporobacter rubrisoli]
MSAASEKVSLWKNRDYLLLWGGQTISNIGSSASRIAFPLLVLFITHSPIQAGLLAAVSSVAYVALLLPAGAWLDRWPRKQAMLYCDIGRALCLLSIPIAVIINHITIVQLYIVGGLISVLEAFFEMAEIASVPQVVAREHLPEAMGRMQVTFGIAQLIGPILGGALFSYSHIAPFLLDTGSYVLSCCSLFFIRANFQQERQQLYTSHLGSEIVEGILHLWKQPLLRYMAVFTGCNVFFGSGYMLLLIILAQQRHASNAVIGLIFSGGGIGSIAGAAAASWLQQRYKFSQLIIASLWLVALGWLLPLILSQPMMLMLATGLINFCCSSL